ARPSAGWTGTRFARSRVRRPNRTRGPVDGAPPVARRSTLFTRARSSRGSNGFCEREPVLAGEANIEQDDSRQFTLDEPAQRRPAVDAGHTEIVFAEVLDQQMALGGLVFNHDDMRPAIRHSGLA